MSTSPLASAGIGSGLDVSAIVEKLMSVERRPLDALATQQSTYQTRISAYGAVKSALAALQGAIGGLTSGAFRAMTAQMSDPSVATVATGAGARSGTHAIEVSKLAQAHRIASEGFTSGDDAVGTGTLTFRFGTWSGGAFTANPAAATGTVAIGAGQSTLAGIRDAVNAAKIGVTASIVDDGGAAGKRLVFTSASGTAMSLKVEVADGDGNALDAAGLSQLAYDPAGAAGAGRNMTQKTVPQNAEFVVDGIAMSRSSNVVSDALEGVTLTLAKTNVGAAATLSLFPGTGNGLAAMDAFVKTYNAVQTTIANLTRYDAEKKQGSVLTGDGTVRLIQAQLRGLVGGTVAGAEASGTGLSTLAQAGVKTASDGTLTLDTAALGKLLANDPAGVERLFTSLGSASDALIAATGSTAKTMPGDYAVTVTRLATRGTLAGSAAADLAIVAGVNDSLTARVDGKSVTVTLGAKTYASAEALAAEVAALLNGTKTLKDAGASVSVAASAGVLTFTSGGYGSGSSVALSGTAAAALVGNAPTATTGVDVAGTIGGVAAVGSGRVLTGAIGSASEGLKLQVAGGALGARGDVRFTRGIGAQLDALVGRLVGSDGLVATRTAGVQATLRLLDKRKAALEDRLERVEAAYLKQYVALDRTIASLSATSTYLGQQLANLPRIGEK